MRSDLRLRPGQLHSGPLFKESMRIVTAQRQGAAVWVVGLVGVQSEKFTSATLSNADLESLAFLGSQHTYDGDAQHAGSWGSRASTSNESDAGVNIRSSLDVSYA